MKKEGTSTTLSARLFPACFFIARLVLFLCPCHVIHISIPLQHFSQKQQIHYPRRNAPPFFVPSAGSPGAATALYEYAATAASPTFCPNGKLLSPLKRK